MSAIGGSADPAVSDSARRVDGELEEIQGSYDFLELLRPTNVTAAWEKFRSGGFGTEPGFEYPEITIDPEALLDRLHARVHQSGGFTRDQIYLRGLRYLVRYLGAGGELEPLYLGKLGNAEIPIIQDLRRTGVLREPPLMPRFLEMEGSAERLKQLREVRSLVSLVDG